MSDEKSENITKNLKTSPKVKFSYLFGDVFRFFIESAEQILFGINSEYQHARDARGYSFFAYKLYQQVHVDSMTHYCTGSENCVVVKVCILNNFSNFQRFGLWQI